MQSVVATYEREPIVRETTVRIMSGLPNNAIAAQVARCVQWVKDHVTYVQDPMDSEYLVSPVRMLSSFYDLGYMAGDCDDHVILLNTMLGSIGIPTKCVGVKFGGSGEFNHVISGVYVGRSMVFVDPCAKGRSQPSYIDKLIV